VVEASPTLWLSPLWAVVQPRADNQAYAFRPIVTLPTANTPTATVPSPITSCFCVNRTKTILAPLRRDAANKNGRGDRIRTYDLLVPNQALYQTKLHPDDRVISDRPTLPLSTPAFGKNRRYLLVDGRRMAEIQRAGLYLYDTARPEDQGYSG
jgi:hypothetical protein